MDAITERPLRLFIAGPAAWLPDLGAGRFGAAEGDLFATTARQVARCCGMPAHALGRWTAYAAASRAMGVWPW